MNYSIGSQWRKWDLHVHTPDSIVEHYTDTSKEMAWERFISELEGLPEEFKVIGINDYIFLDGYKKILQYKESGRLENIDLFLPIIEIRLDKFGGSNSHLSRVNYHIIFSNKISPEVIQAHFINALPRSYKLSSIAEGIEWNALATKESLMELGSKIKKTIPEDRISEFGDDLQEGFNNINFSLEKVIKVLETSHYFKGKYLTAVGKTEWYDIKWNDQSIAEKKNIINGANFVFVSAENVDLFHRAKQSLTGALVNDFLLDCSDAHNFSDSTEKDRIGKCFTWLKADTTFEGLKQILNEKVDRVYVGDLPPKLSKVQKNKSKYIKSLHIHKKDQSTEDDVWFNNDIIFNSDLVAIIGNKGSGKSALADIISLVGNTTNYEDFSFLTKNKFRKSNLARNFEAKIKWESNIEETPLSLDINPESSKQEKVKYLPQQFLEKLCNNENNKFENELKKVIFSHVSEEDRLSKTTLDELIEHNSQTIMQAIEIIKLEVVNLNKKIIKLEKKSKQSTIKEIEEKINSKLQELSIHDFSKPQEEKIPTETPEIQNELKLITESITELNETKNALISNIDLSQQNLNKIKIKLSAIKSLNEKLDNFEKQYEVLKSGISEEIKLLEINADNVIKLNIERDIINEIQTKYDIENLLLIKQLTPDNESSLIYKKNIIESEIIALQNKLDEPNKKYQVYISALKQWEQHRINIIGDKDKIDTLTYYQNELDYIKSTLPEELKKLIEEREKKASDIYEQTTKLVLILEKLYEPVQTYFTTHKLSDPGFQLNFEVVLNAADFIDGFLNYINQGARGNFYGNVEGRKQLQTLIDDLDFKNPDVIIHFLNKVLLLLEEKQDQSQKYEIQNQLKKSFTIEDLYNYMFSLEFLIPSYGLKLGEKELSKLSPGEKGALLLMFYLLVDKDDIPLIIDQPEENLDNQSVFNMLVPAIKSAKNHRQIIMVTHNPNLAVVCDAEQIVFAKIDKNDKHRIEYLSGAIENPEINQKIIDVLEGTMPAFNNRNSKYFR